MRPSTFSRDETEWGAFGDSFGAALISTPKINAPQISAPTISRPTVPSVPSVSQSVLRTTGAGNLASGISTTGVAALPAGTIRGAPIASVKPGTPLADVLLSVANKDFGVPVPANITSKVTFAPVPLAATSTVQGAPIASVKPGTPLADVLLSVANKDFGVPVPANIASKVTFAPLPLPSATKVARATGPIASAPVASAPVASTAPKTTTGVAGAIAAVQATRNRAKVAPKYAPVQGVVSSAPARVSRAPGTAPVTTQVQAPVATTIYMLYDVTNGGKIVRNPSGVDTVNPQWLVDSTGQVVRLG